jgi:hypothetical protein
MADQSLPVGGYAERDFNIGHVFNRTASIFSRNLLPFCLVSLVANLPNIALFMPKSAASSDVGVWSAVAIPTAMVLNTLSQAVIVHAAFDDMRGRPINMMESFKTGLRRFFPVLGIAICVPILAGLAALALFFPAFIVLTMLFVSAPACVVERLGPFKSMGRSARLTKGNRWKIFGLWFATLIVEGMVQSTLTGLPSAGGGSGSLLSTPLLVIWGAVYGAFSAVLAVVTYNDLRVAKEGIDTNQIASVFD